MAGVATLGASALLLTACGAAPEAGSTSTAEASDYTGCIVSDSGGFDDQSFNQSSYEGLKKAETDLGIKVNQVESKTNNDFEPNLRAMVSAGCDLTVTVGFLLGDATKAQAEANPDSHFAIVDFGYETPIANVKPIIYDTAQAAFLAGYLAAGTTKTGTVATFGGIKLPTVTIFMDGYADGVKYYNEQKGKDVKLIWVDSDGYLTAPDYKDIMLSSVMKTMGDAVENVVKEDKEGNFDNTPYVGTLANDGVQLAPFHDLDSQVPAELKSELEQIKKDIIDGKLKVESAASPKA